MESSVSFTFDCLLKNDAAAHTSYDHLLPVIDELTEMMRSLTRLVPDHFDSADVRMLLTGALLLLLSLKGLMILLGENLVILIGISWSIVALFAFVNP